MERVCPVLFPSDAVAGAVDSFGVRIVPAKQEVLYLASNAALVEISHDGETVTSLGRRSWTKNNDLPTGPVARLFNDESIMPFFPMMLRRLVLQRFYTDHISSYLGFSRTLRILGRVLCGLGWTVCAMVDSEMFHASGTKVFP